jgi:Transposase DDE domain
MKFLSMPIS